MENIKIKNPQLNKQYLFLIETYYKSMPEEQINFAKMVIINFKKNSSNEELIILTLLYGLIYFSKIDIDNEHICSKNRLKILKLKELLMYEIKWQKEEFLNEIYKLDDEMLYLKMIIKYTVILYENKWQNIIVPNARNNYFKSVGHIIPYLTLKESKLLSFFQDTYFKKLYPQQFIKTKMIYLEKMKKSWTTWGYIISIVNNLNEWLFEAGLSARIQMRKKSYFSIFNKIKRKLNAEFLDSIWVRMIFKDLEELQKFEEVFETKFIYTKKKDYINTPKENGYQSLHYTFMTPYANNEVFVELQLRTEQMDKNIREAKEISHYSYTIKANKWDGMFEEVQFWYKHLLNYIEKQKK